MARQPLSSMKLSRATICAALLVSALPGCRRAPDSESLLMEAQQYRQSGETRAAIIQLKNALQKEPDNAKARALLGEVYLDSGDPLSAEKELRMARALGAKPAEIVPLLGKAMLMLGQAEQVLKEIKPDPASPDQPEIIALRAHAHLAAGDTEQARSLFEQILKKQPGFAEALLGLARIALAASQPDQAATLVEQALAKSPDHIDSLRLKGDLLRRQKNNDGAREAYTQILRLRPDHTRARIDLANMDIDAGQFPRARSEIEAARKNAPNSVLVIHAQALLDFREGMPKAALDSLQKLLSAAPNHMPSLLLMSAVQMALGSPEQAEHYVLSFLQANPKHAYASKILASLMIEKGKPDAALEIVKPLLKADPEDMELLTLAGEAQMRARRYGQAAEYFQKASDLSPKTASLHTALAVSRLGMGENDRAIAELEQASTLDARSAPAGIMLVMAHLRAKEFDKALAAVNAMLPQQSDNPLVHNLKGGVLLAREDRAGARASFQKALSLDPAYVSAMENLAQLDMAEKKPDQARQRFEAALAKDPKNARLMTSLSKLAAAKGKQAEALRWLERAHQENPEELTPAILLSNAYLKVGEKQKALALAQKLQSSNPSNAEAQALLAHVQNASGDLRAALESYIKLSALEPRSAALQMRIAGLRVALNDRDGALQAVKKALDLEPGLLVAQRAEVVLLLAKGSRAEALAVAQSVQKQKPNLPDGFKLEGDIWMEQNKPLSALKLYEQAFGMDKTGPLQVNIYQALISAGKTQEANARINQWLQQHPTDLPTRFYLAGSSMSRKQYKPAIEQFEKIIQQAPKNIVALNNLASAYQQDKDPRALPTAERAYALQSGNPAVIDTLGWIVLEQGDAGRAVSLLKKAAELAPKATEISYHLGAALARSGDKKAARAHLERLLANNKDFPDRADAQALLTQL
jgi:putative PEP-CTERM system TPR-repeat lipoprotein